MDAEDAAGVGKKQPTYEQEENDGMRKDADVLTKVFVVSPSHLSFVELS